MTELKKKKLKKQYVLYLSLNFDINLSFYIFLNDRNDLVNNDVAYDNSVTFWKNAIPCPFRCMLLQMQYQIICLIIYN